MWDVRAQTRSGAQGHISARGNVRGRAAGSGSAGPEAGRLAKSNRTSPRSGTVLKRSVAPGYRRFLAPPIRSLTLFWACRENSDKTSTDAKQCPIVRRRIGIRTFRVTSRKILSFNSLSRCLLNSPFGARAARSCLGGGHQCEKLRCSPSPSY
jgi:hypothetical protein